MQEMRKVILASSSPRRIKMMKEHDMDHVVIPAHVDENIPMSMSLESTVMFLALKKAAHVAELIEEEADTGKKTTESDASCSGASHCLSAGVITAADTVVYKDGIMGKPADRDEAIRMLSSLRSTDHIVATGVAMICPKTGKKLLFCEKTRVWFGDFTDEELSAYADTDEPYDKAGAYAVQGTMGKYIDHLDGDLDNVIGFPYSRFEEALKIFSTKG
ncbi:MAG: septum formation protein Maf [Firmicutes bacterium]|nr:septum formation protein Maf [Bacillota bacterium]